MTTTLDMRPHGPEPISSRESLVISSMSPADSLLSMAEQGTLQAQLEQETWKVLKHLASSVPEACVHFQGE